MRNAHIWTLVGLVALAVIAGSLKAQQPAEKEEAAVKGKLRHVVMFKFKDDAPAAEVKKIEDAFRALPSKIPEIVDLEWGTNNSPEGLADGFTHCFLLTFNDDKGRAAYLPHPAHKQFGALLRPHLDKVLVIDYFAAE